LKEIKFVSKSRSLYFATAIEVGMEMGEVLPTAHARFTMNVLEYYMEK
jgi:hypothetical protein